MIILNRIKLSNFLSHSETLIDFKRDEKLLIDGKSGSGKSSIPEAIIWCLYGEGRSDNKNLVKHGAKVGYVELEMQDREVTYRVKRLTTDKSKNTLEVYSRTGTDNWKPIDRVGIKDTQDWIENEFLHASYELFINSIAYPQDNVNNFVKQTASKRKDLLLEIANIKNFDMYYSKAKDSVNSVLSEINGIDTSVSANTFSRDMAKSQIIDEDVLENLTAKHKEEIAIKRTEHDYLKAKRIALKSSLEEIEKIKKAIESKDISFKTSTLRSSEKMKQIEEIKKIDIEPLKTKVTEYEKVKAERELLDTEIKADYERSLQMNSIMADKPAFHDYDKDVSDLKKQIEPLVKDIKVCPAGDDCPFITPIKNQIQYVEEQIKTKLLQKDKMEKDLEVYQVKISSLGAPKVSNEVRTHYDSLRASERLLELSRAVLEGSVSRISTLPGLESEFFAFQQDSNKFLIEINVLTDELSKKNSETDLSIIPQLDQLEITIVGTINMLEENISKNNSLVSLSKNARSTVKTIEEKINERLEQKKKLMVQIEALNAIKDAFGSKGLKTVVIDYLIPILEDKINEILARLSEFRVRLETQKSSADGESTIEGLYINIINEKGEELEFSSYSGGEKVRITIAISEALATLQKCGFRILDEIITGLSSEMTTDFVNVLNDLQNLYPQVICISHLTEVKDAFEKRITIQKIDGTSKIV